MNTKQTKSSLIKKNLIMLPMFILIRRELPKPIDFIYMLVRYHVQRSVRFNFTNDAMTETG